MKIVKNDSALMLEYNRQLLLQLIHTKGPISRAELTKMTKLSPTTVGRIINSFMEEDLITAVGTTKSGLGRKALLIDINGSGRYAIGIDIDIYQISAGMSNLNGEIVLRKSAPTPDSYSPEAIAEVSLRLIEEINTCATPQMAKQVLGVGISIPGNVQWDDGIVRTSPQLGWKNVAFKELLQSKYKKPIYVDNNVKATAASEILFGFGKKYADFVILHVGSGVGAAVVSNRSVCRGVNGMYGEIGHITLRPTERLCDCGLHGCMQTYICMSALEKKSGMPFSDIQTRAKNGDMFCRSLLNESTEHLAMLLSNIVNMYDPPLILLSGEMFDNSIELVEDVKKRAKPLMWHTMIQIPCIENATFVYKDNVILAAASVVFQDFFLSPIAI